MWYFSCYKKRRIKNFEDPWEQEQGKKVDSTFIWDIGFDKEQE